MNGVFSDDDDDENDDEEDNEDFVWYVKDDDVKDFVRS